MKLFWKRASTCLKKFNMNKRLKIKTFKAAVLFKQKSKLKLIDLDFPKKLEKGQVLVKINKFGICGAQINEINGVKGKDRFLPHLMGHEGYGKIVKVGPSVKKFKKSQNVVLHWRKSSGINAKPYVYFSKKFGKINSGQVTTFSQYSVVSENRLSTFTTKKINEKFAPLLGCCLPTAFFLLKKETIVNKNQNILISGMGGLGLSIAICAKISGLKKVISLDKTNKSKKIINNMGFKYFSTKNKNVEQLLNLKVFDRIIDTTGNNKLISYFLNF